MECEKCKSIMAKKGTMDSGNSKYEQFMCRECGHEKMICVGLK